VVASDESTDSFVKPHLNGEQPIGAIMFSISKVDYFPEITRQGRVSEELQQIVDALHNSATNGERFCIDGVDSGNAYNSMQQRIRAQAKKYGYKVTIRFDKDENKLYFKATHGTSLAEIGNTDDEVGVSASDAKASTKRTAKTS